MSTFGTFVKKKRNELNLTQAQVANKMGIAIYQHISNLERGTSVSPSFAVKLGKVLGVKKEEIAEEYIKDKVAKLKKEFGV